MKHIFVFIMLAASVIGSLAQSKSYFVSTNGSDSNEGTSIDNAWETIDKVNNEQSRFQPGDKVLFRCGDVFNGQLQISATGTKEQPIVIDSFGDGNKPIISGARLISGWEPYNGNIYRAYCGDDEIKNLFLSDHQMSMARYPNSGFLKIERTNENKGITCKKLNQGIQYWQDAKILLRTNDWTWENKAVKSFIAGSITFDNLTQYYPQVDWGFCLYNKLGALDSISEWCYDKNTGYVYFWPPDNSDPSNLKIEGCIHDLGISITGQFVEVRNLQIEKQNHSGIKISNDNNSITGNTISNISHTGIELSGSSTRISNCNISDINGVGILGKACNFSVISFCDIKRIGLHPQLSESGQHHQIGLHINFASNVFINHNTIDSVGYSAIQYDGDSGVIERNMLSNAMLRLNDGGAFYSYGNYSHHNIIRNNFINTAVGCSWAKPESAVIALGIYLDNGTNNNLVENNTVSGTSCGLQGNAGTHYNKFIKNVSYGNEVQLGLYDWMADEHISGYVIRGNVLFNTLKDQRPIEVLYGNDVSQLVDTVNSNYYFNPFNTNLILPGNRNFDRWRAEVDSEARFSFYQEQASSNIRSELVTNKTDDLKTIDLAGHYVDLNQVPISKVTLQPYSSQVIVRDDETAIGFRGKSSSDTEIVQIFPNPVPSGSSLQLQNSGFKGFTITDIVSRKSYCGNINNQRIDLVSLKSGIYILQVFSESKSLSTKVIIK